MISLKMSDSELCSVLNVPSSLYIVTFLQGVVTVVGRDVPVRNSVLPEHMTDLPNFIGLSSRWVLMVI